MIESLHEECGVFGIYGSEGAAESTFLGLYALQHRGQEGAGIVSTDGDRMYEHKGMGLVAQVFDEESIARLKGKTAIGHNRYSTTGLLRAANIQPLLVDCRVGKLALAHNGNLVNARELRKQMEAEGSIFNTTMDSEVILHLIARSKERGSRFDDRRRGAATAGCVLRPLVDEGIAHRRSRPAVVPAALYRPEG